MDGAADVLTDLTVKAGDVNGTASADTGIGEITVVNNTGAELPSTGGIGTTIFYIFPEECLLPLGIPS